MVILWIVCNSQSHMIRYHQYLQNAFQIANRKPRATDPNFHEIAPLYTVYDYQEI